MRLGLLADIHEEVDLLRLALDRFRHEAVDQVVVLGDVAETGERLTETTLLLAGAGAVGVWGNHDFGLCRERALIYVAAVSDGWCAVFDTGAWEITPIRLRDP